MKLKSKHYYVLKALLVVTLIAVAVKSFLNQDIAVSSAVALIVGILSLNDVKARLFRK